MGIKLAKKLSFIAGILIFFYVFLSAKFTPSVNAGCNTAAGDYCYGSTVLDLMVGCNYIYDPIYHKFLYCTQKYDYWTEIYCDADCNYSLVGLECTNLTTCATGNHTHSGTCCVNGPSPTPPSGNPTDTPVPTTAPTATPTPLPCPSGFNVDCNATGNQATISWNALSGASGYVLRVNKDPYGDWFGTGDIWEEPVNPSQTIDITPAVNYTYDVQGKKPGEVYPYSGARCPFTEFNCLPPLSIPTGACGSPSANTPITWTWDYGNGLQCKSGSFSLGGTWYYNNWHTSPLTITGIGTGTEACARTTNDFSTFSSESCIACPTLTPTDTPTPTATPTPGPWKKLKDTSFYSNNNLTSNIPLHPDPFDSNDTTDPYFIIGDGGLVAASGIDLGHGQANALDQSILYSPGFPSFTPSAFLSYVKARKEYTEIKDHDITKINSDGIYLYDGNLTLNNAGLSQIAASKFVLIVDGDVTIDQDEFNIGNNCIDTTSSKSFAILSTTTHTIYFSNTTKCAAGIFIANTIDPGTTSNLGLKIVGNLIAQSTFINNTRRGANLNAPSLFIVFKPQQYLDLLPYLSIANYDWRQIQ